ncbi:hypothetical protein [Methylobacterium currus]|uniref:hypothetical protein n=1 Tax=Methylobacterium currus TaxID=2051553 RepID=UPI000F517006|nr:hypothetical protein [Methylobacterium currus]
MDMALVRENFSRLKPDEQLLWRVLATTGMRRTEAFHIDREFQEAGIRCVIIDVGVRTRTRQSDRRMPLPDILLPYIPAKINKPLFGGADPGIVGKRLLSRIRELGILSETKVIHSLRHRAMNRLRAEGCPSELMCELLGYEEKSPWRGHGRGFPVPMLKRWVDVIGF